MQGRSRGFGRFLPCRDYCTASRNQAEKARQVGRRDYFEKFVGSIVFQSAHFGGSVVEGDTCPGAEIRNGGLVEAASVFSDETGSVAEKHKSEYPPHIVVEIRIEEIHRPPLPFRRETAEH